MQAAAGPCCVSIPSLARTDLHPLFCPLKRPSVSRFCLEPALSALDAFLPSESQSVYAAPHLGFTHADRTNCSRIPAVAGYKRSDTSSCEQVQDSCIQSTQSPPSWFREPVFRLETNWPFVPISIRTGDSPGFCTFVSETCSGPRSLLPSPTPGKPSCHSATTQVLAAKTSSKISIIVLRDRSA
ncbi:hypothetical protein N658DRAFT_258089 [Parathielavia hyrcaniae]|uniref:Uncharacterized protein n=1 Tax=Parathielavia hyrcaniae TaxID=113614 RepID=A0AAN6SXW7_9PEZI|nr:hypothetical protein N658DRAFT_258089 [Parathielavia hyrcaniae]